jgi:hypothetical protein
MPDVLPAIIDSHALAAALPLAGPVIAIELPEPVASALKIAVSHRLARASWRSWVNRIGDAQTVLYWVSPREADDQEFLFALGAALKPGALLYSFHAMGMLTVDRLTGDAVLTLLETFGLRDAGCVNTGIGYYARRMKRDPNAKPEPLPEAAASRREDADGNEVAPEFVSLRVPVTAAPKPPSQSDARPLPPPAKPRVAKTKPAAKLPKQPAPTKAAPKKAARKRAPKQKQVAAQPARKAAARSKQRSKSPASKKTAQRKPAPKHATTQKPTKPAAKRRSKKAGRRK